MNVLVYGAGSPIAQALGRKLLSQGHSCGMVSRTGTVEASFSPTGPELTFFAQDFLDESRDLEALTNFESEAGPCHGVVFCHRFRGPSRRVRDHFRVEVEAPFRVISELGNTGGRPGCSIVLVTSPAASHHVGDQEFSYHASKASLEILARWGAFQFGSAGIRVNAVCPEDPVYKERARNFFLAPPRWLTEYENVSPLGGILKPDEIADVIVFLLSSASSKITGQVLRVGGGASLAGAASLFSRLAYSERAKSGSDFETDQN